MNKTTQTSSQPPAVPLSRTKPAHELRLGAIKAAIWENKTEKGVRHQLTFRRLYKDGDHWKSSDSFGRDDLLLLAKLADQAHSWIHQQEAAPVRPE